MAWPLPSTAGPGAIGGPWMGKPQGRVSLAGPPTWLLSLQGRQLTLLCGRVIDGPALWELLLWERGPRTSGKSSHVVPSYGF